MNSYVKTTLAQALALTLCGAIPALAWGYGSAVGPAAANTPTPAASATVSQLPQPQDEAQTQSQSEKEQQSGKAKAKSQSQAKKNAVKLSTVTVNGTFVTSLALSADAKQDAVNVTDSVYAEGIGKMPDVNIAESLSRIPGVQLSRDATGQGLDVSIRGLGPSFSKVTLDGGDVSTAAVGLNQQNQDREVDLNLFPSEFFDRLKISKTPEASMMAGGIAGTVDLRLLRPFDNPGAHVVYSLKEGMTDASDRQSAPQGTVIGSWTNSSNTFGIMGGVNYTQTKQNMKGYESVGWTTPGLSYAQCGLAAPAGSGATLPAPSSSACNSVGGGNWTIPATVPLGAGAGLTPGQTIDENFLLQHNPGLNINQISNALIPRLGAPLYVSDDQRNHSAMASLEYKPNDNVDLYLDLLYAKQNRETDRIDMDLIGRNGVMIPTDMKLAPNGVVTSATFANAQYFLEARPYVMNTQFWSVNPGGDFYFDDQEIRLHVQGNLNRSWLSEQVPSMLLNSPFTTVQYSNTGGVTSALSSVDLDDPNAGWTWNRLNIQNSSRTSSNKGIHADIRFGDDDNNIDAGIAYNDNSLEILGFDNSTAWQKVVCDGAGDVCNGGPGSAVPTSAIASYLFPGPAGFINIDAARLMAATNYAELSATAPVSTSVQTGASSGGFDDYDGGAFIQLNTTSQLLGRPLRFNAGMRYVTTRDSFNGPTVLPSGATQFQSFSSNFSDLLPSFNVAWNLTPSVILRLAGSRSMTRPDPSSMLPETVFSDPSAQTATQGNPTLTPYLSTNFDIGGEWYTGGAGYVSLDVFTKQITGFTVNGIRTIPFTQLGIPYDSLLPVQQTALQQRGGPNVATVDVESQVNASGLLKIFGQEVDWVQPIDWVTPGLGIKLDFSHVQQSSSGSGVPAVAVGIAPKLWNGTIYYDRGPFDTRLAYSWSASQIASSPNQNGIPTAVLMGGKYKQLDFSAGYVFNKYVQVTLSVLNLTKSRISTYFGSTNALYEQYSPGRTVMLGIHGSF